MFACKSFQVQKVLPHALRQSSLEVRNFRDQNVCSFSICLTLKYYINKHIVRLSVSEIYIPVIECMDEHCINEVLPALNFPFLWQFTSRYTYGSHRGFIINFYVITNVQTGKYTVEKSIQTVREQRPRKRPRPRASTPIMSVSSSEEDLNNLDPDWVIEEGEISVFDR